MKRNNKTQSFADKVAMQAFAPAEIQQSFANKVNLQFNSPTNCHNHNNTTTAPTVCRDVPALLIEKTVITVADHLTTSFEFYILQFSKYTKMQLEDLALQFNISLPADVTFDEICRIFAKVQVECPPQPPPPLPPPLSSSLSSPLLLLPPPPQLLLLPPLSPPPPLVAPGPHSLVQLPPPPLPNTPLQGIKTAISHVDIQQFSNNPLEFHIWMVQQNLLSNFHQCIKCKSENIKLEENQRFVHDGIAWKCCSCSHTWTVRKYSSFEHSNCSISLQMHLLIEFLANSKQCATAKTWNLSEHTVSTFWQKYKRENKGCY